MAARAAPRILVVGDLMLDRYLWGRCNRISPEAPVPVVDVVDTTETLGGAGNVLENLVTLGAHASLGSVIGSGESSETVKRLLFEKNIETAGLLIDQTRKLSEKTRIVAAHSQIVRYDVETRDLIDDNLENRIVKHVNAHITELDAVIISDYGKGVVTPSLCQRVIAICNEIGVPVLCDPKGLDYSRYKRATIITPNRKEASEATGIVITDDVTLAVAGTKLLGQFDLQYALITLSEQGMALFHSGGIEKLPTRAREVFDVTGAGDTVISALAFALGRGDTMFDACRFANIAAGIVVGKFGAATTTLEEILSFDDSDFHIDAKIRSVDEVIARIAGLRSTGKRIVFTNGCFDILHSGHVRYLEAASRFGDLLVIGLNTDASTRRLKGPERPINSEIDRAYVLSALQFVDYVVLFDEDTPYELIRAINPDVLVKGGDYTTDTIVGADLIKAAGGIVTTIPLFEGKSTTSTIGKIRELGL